MKTTFTITIMLLLLSGCTITHKEVEWGSQVCEANSGFNHIQATINARVAICNSGAVFYKRNNEF